MPPSTTALSRVPIPIEDRQTARRRATRGGDRAAGQTFGYAARVKIRVTRKGEEQVYECDEEGTKIVLETEHKVASIAVTDAGGFHIEVDTRKEGPSLAAVPDLARGEVPGPRAS